MDGSTFIPAPPRIHRKRKRVTATSPVSPLTLVSATYEPGDSVTLTFDRAIDIDALDAAAVVLMDGEYAFGRFVGSAGASLASATTVVVPLTMGEGWLTAGVRLTVSAANGIVASEDGAAWAGVTELELPFGF